MPLASKVFDLAEAQCGKIADGYSLPIPNCASKLSRRFMKPAVFVVKRAVKHCDSLIDKVVGGTMNRVYICSEGVFSAVTSMQERVEEAVRPDRGRNNAGARIRPSGNRIRR